MLHAIAVTLVIWFVLALIKGLFGFIVRMWVVRQVKGDQKWHRF